MRILALDYGNKRIGLAISDETGTIAQPVGYATGGVTEVLRVATERGAGKIVVGLPRRLDGTASEQTERTQEFIDALKRATTMTVESWDERLTSVQAERVLLEGDVRRVERRQKRDQLAATILLQSYLDAQQEIRNPNPEIRDKSE
ncbi:MAG TPA: Holliday junction resolvase RuvX [Verrucomicrobiae bacterium]|nr:Holliday junction resolvase RuvX [Verrucomicrobiae bacterium]